MAKKSITAPKPVVEKYGCKHPFDSKLPSGYVEWHEKVTELYKAGWKQNICHHCGLYKIWISPKGREFK